MSFGLGHSRSSTRQWHDEHAVVCLIHHQRAVSYRINRHAELLRDGKRNDCFDRLRLKIHDREGLTIGIDCHEGAAAIVVVDGRGVNPYPIRSTRNIRPSRWPGGDRKKAVRQTGSNQKSIRIGIVHRSRGKLKAGFSVQDLIGAQVDNDDLIRAGLRNGCNISGWVNSHRAGPGIQGKGGWSAGTLYRKEADLRRITVGYNGNSSPRMNSDTHGL